MSLDGAETPRVGRRIGRHAVDAAEIVVCMNSAWYGREQMTRTLIRYFRSQPANPYETVNSVADIEVVGARSRYP